MTDLFDVTGKVAIVTGAASGIGRALAHGLAESGMSIVAVDIRRDDLLSLEQELGDAGHPNQIVVADVSVQGDVEEAVSAAHDTFQGLDLLVNNAGISVTAPVLELDIADWQRVLDVDLTGVLRFAQVAGRSMVEAGGGSIVNISSQLGEVTRPGRAAYSVAKAGVRMLTKALAIDLGPSNIRVNAVAPGPIDVERTRPLLTGPSGASYMARMVLERFGRPDELVGAVLFLASSASSFVTGSTITVDGGYLTT